MVLRPFPVRRGCTALEPARRRAGPVVVQSFNLEPSCQSRKRREIAGVGKTRNPLCSKALRGGA